jgi:hypothetical protein
MRGSKKKMGELVRKREIKRGKVERERKKQR